jgi:hypothetical protein
VTLTNYRHPAKSGKINTRLSDHTMVLGSTWPLIGVVGKGGRCARLTNPPPSLEICEV